jgi:hypothetical protein
MVDLVSRHVVENAMASINIGGSLKEWHGRERSMGRAHSWNAALLIQSQLGARTVPGDGTHKWHNHAVRANEHRLYSPTAQSIS